MISAADKDVLSTIAAHEQLVFDDRTLSLYMLKREAVASLVERKLLATKAGIGIDESVVYLTATGKLELARFDKQVSLSEQLRAAKRELAMRERVYPKWVAASKMKQDAADNEIHAMRAICRTLQALVNFGAELRSGGRE
jgi:hypothetical protein